MSPSRQVPNSSSLSEDKTAAPFLSVLIPTYNERDNVPALVNRLMRALGHQGYEYELLFIDDHSTDGTMKYLRTLKDVRIRVMSKKGEKGKAFSILEGMKEARGEAIAMIDADLQYPPEAIPAMVRKLFDADIVVAERSKRETSLLRSMLSKAYRFVFGKLLLTLTVDIQSGLKVFKKKTLSGLKLQPTAWGFDYQFLFLAKRKGATMTSEDIVFEDREHGESKVRALATGIELIRGALQLRWKSLKQDMARFAGAESPKQNILGATDASPRRIAYS